MINGDRVTLFSTVPELFAVDVTEPEGVSILATRPTDDLRATILLEDGRFMSWGFDFDVGFLNGNGTALLVNCVEFLASL
ncbi:MAG: hypothetical protein M5R36_03890 [Deltaproteobacteria bacterium]|nr:hypothetical protein [Deltaproteobacteria bacterium]